MSTKGRPLQLGLIADEETCAGFLLAGIGHLDSQSNPVNYLAVDKFTTILKVDHFYKHLLSRKDIGIILITHEIAAKMRREIPVLVEALPIVMIIPSNSSISEFITDVVISYDESIADMKKEMYEDRQL